MMIFNKVHVQIAANNVERFANIELVFNERDLFVLADNSQAINEFETQLAAATLEWDGDSTDGRQLMDNLVNIQGVRTEFRPRTTRDEWQARYNIVAQ